VIPPPAVELAPGGGFALDMVRAVDGLPPRRATRVELEASADRLIVRFDAEAPAPWATIRERDGRLWEEEVVELFAAAGADDPRRYVEIEVNPLGTVFDALVDSPAGDRRGMTVDASWNCQGLATAVEIDTTSGRWRTRIELPWRALGAGGAMPREVRLNLFRIERPRDGRAPEYSAWSPTYVEPADFHRPSRFASVKFFSRVDS
jgi:hypothetical protein